MIKSNNQKIGIYPGTFDPITNGHLDIIQRSIMLFDTVIVAVTNNPKKSPLFTVDERVDMVKTVVQGINGIEVDSFQELLVNYAQRRGATALIRGLRATSDFEYEFQMALVNRKLASNLLTVFLMPNEKYTYLNSTIVKELARLNGEISDFVPKQILERIKLKLH
jgi:pantetheine-phosphate adenylyltransferase